MAAFIRIIQGHPFEDLFLTTLFLVLREGEALGLTWDCVDLDNGVITVNKQLQLHQEKGLAAYELVPTKNSRSRTLVASPMVVAHLRHRKAEQAQQRLMAGCAWEGNDLVFTDALGHHLTKPTVYRHYKKAVAAIGRPDARYHDLRHPYVKHTTKIFILRLKVLQAQRDPDRRRKTCGAFRLHRKGLKAKLIEPILQ